MLTFFYSFVYLFLHFWHFVLFISTLVSANFFFSSYICSCSCCYTICTCIHVLTWHFDQFVIIFSASLLCPLVVGFCGRWIVFLPISSVTYARTFKIDDFELIIFFGVYVCVWNCVYVLEKKVRMWLLFSNNDSQNVLHTFWGNREGN